VPKDDRAIRPPSFRAKLSQIKGVAPEEKALLQRIGNLVDVLTFDQRQSQNPRIRRRRPSLKVPKPSNVAITGITGGIQVTWNEVAVSELDFYEVQIAESVTFVNADVFEVVGTSISYRDTPASGTIFLRLRTVTKRGQVSDYTATLSAIVAGSSIFASDQDHIEPENRTSVSPKPTLIGAELSPVDGAEVFVGIGAMLGPSPLTLDDTHQGGNTNLRHEVTYTLHSPASPFPGLEQRRAPTIGEYIDADAFYTYSPGFYMRMAVLPNSITDFFVVTEVEEDPSEFDVEFLRYRILNDFYVAGFAQAGYVFNAALSTIKF